MGTRAGGEKWRRGIDYGGPSQLTNPRGCRSTNSTKNRRGAERKLRAQENPPSPIEGIGSEITSSRETIRQNPLGGEACSHHEGGGRQNRQRIGFTLGSKRVHQRLTITKSQTARLTRWCTLSTSSPVLGDSQTKYACSPHSELIA